ncbi:MAG: hypothetical protein M1820_000642 [Bogoriella megaspora]|nr:MAG: hypothetical protein M1820_000642 [Bogoriella megaspora]
MSSSQATPSYVNDKRSPPASHIVVPLMIVSTLSVIARLYSRHLKKVQLAAHDYLIVGGLVLAWGCAGTTIKMYAYGPIFGTTILVVKASIICFLAQVFSVKRVVVLLYMIAASVVAWWGVSVFMGLFQCNPVRGAWDKTVSAKCIDSKAYFIGTAVPNTVTDFCLLLIPIYEVWHLQMPRVRKASISAIFVLGAFVCAASIIRIYYLFQEGLDITWDLYDDAVWGSIEPSVGVICACIPTILPALEKGIFKPVLKMSSSLQSILRPSTEFSSEVSKESKKEGRFRTFQRLNESQKFDLAGRPDGIGSNATVHARREFDEERDSVLLSSIKVRHEYDVERIAN